MRSAGLVAGPEVERQASVIRTAARRLDFRTQLEPAQTAKQAARAIGQLLDEVELVIAMFDPDVLTPKTGRWLLQAAHHRRLPVIAFSEAYVNAGALAAVFSDPAAIGEQAADALMEWSSRRRWVSPRAYPKVFRVAVNDAVATALGLEPPPIPVLLERVGELSARHSDRSP